jgi:hypothetical protein
MRRCTQIGQCSTGRWRADLLLTTIEIGCWRSISHRDNPTNRSIVRRLVDESDGSERTLHGLSLGAENENSG